MRDRNRKPCTILHNAGANKGGSPTDRLCTAVQNCARSRSALAAAAASSNTAAREKRLPPNRYAPAIGFHLQRRELGDARLRGRFSHGLLLTTWSHAIAPQPEPSKCATEIENHAQSCTTPLQTKAVPQRIDCAPPSKTVHDPGPPLPQRPQVQTLLLGKSDCRLTATLRRLASICHEGKLAIPEFAAGFPMTFCSRRGATPSLRSRSRQRARPRSTTMHNLAQRRCKQRRFPNGSIVHRRPKLCTIPHRPCRGGRKFKHCCWGKDCRLTATLRRLASICNEGNLAMPDFAAGFPTAFCSRRGATPSLHSRNRQRARPKSTTMHNSAQRRCKQSRFPNGSIVHRRPKLCTNPHHRPPRPVVMSPALAAAAASSNMLLGKSDCRLTATLRRLASICHEGKLAIPEFAAGFPMAFCSRRGATPSLHSPSRQSARPRSKTMHNSVQRGCKQRLFSIHGLCKATQTRANPAQSTPKTDRTVPCRLFLVPLPNAWPLRRLAAHNIIPTPPSTQPERSGIEFYLSQSRIPTRAANVRARNPKPCTILHNGVANKARSQLIDCAKLPKTVHKPRTIGPKTGRKPALPGVQRPQSKHCFWEETTCR